ncbi:MAG TPA: hypothetical protein VGS08_01280 [Candidatus Saccharimonadales bacterium]|nr:hypothetical protein [Candidatus Saccharimonadales bacterium]
MTCLDRRLPGQDAPDYARQQYLLQEGGGGIGAGAVYFVAGISPNLPAGIKDARKQLYLTGHGKNPSGDCKFDGNLGRVGWMVANRFPSPVGALFLEQFGLENTYHNYGNMITERASVLGEGHQPGELQRVIADTAIEAAPSVFELEGSGVDRTSFVVSTGHHLFRREDPADIFYNSLGATLNSIYSHPDYKKLAVGFVAMADATQMVLRDALAKVSPMSTFVLSPTGLEAID